MKNSYVDFLLCGLVLGLVIAFSYATMAFGAVPLSTVLFGDYHVVVDALVALLCYGLYSALAVRVMLKLHPVVPGVYSLDSPAFTYWKLLTIVYRLGEAALIPFTPVFLKPLVESLFGAKIGAGVALGGVIEDPYMVTLGDGVVLGRGSLVSGNMFANGKIHIGTITIHEGAMVGINATVLPGAEVGAGAQVTGGAIVIAGSKIPNGENWRGIPARKWM